MADETKIVRERQKAIRRAMDKRGIAIKAVQLDGGWETPSTVLSYFPSKDDADPAVMSVAALYRLIDTEALPLDLLSLLLPSDCQIIRTGEEIDHDELCSIMSDYIAEKNRAHHPDSEAGRDIGPGEHASLTGKVMQLRAVA